MRTIALLFTNFGPYHAARVTALTEKALEQDNIRITGIELVRNYTVYKWRADISNLPFELHTVSNDKEMSLMRPSSLSLIAGLKRKLRELKPDIVAIAGYSNPAMLAALHWCRKNNAMTILMSETSEMDFERSRLKEWLKRKIVKQFHSALVGGRPHKRYLVKLGMDASRIFTGYDVVDNAAFHPSHISDLPRPCNKQYFLAINRFIKKKNLPFLIKAYADYRKQTEQPWDLVLCGDGELREHITALVEELKLIGCVHLPGFLQQEQLLPYFAHADCFVHASTREQWGLVVNEAMAAGLPVLVSNRCGCAEDLVTDGQNGFTFDPENKTELTSLMHKTSSGSVDLEAMGKSSLEIIENFSPAFFAEGLLQAAQK